MKNVVEILIRVLSVNFISTLNAKVQGRWRVVRKSDGNPMVVANLSCLGVSGIWATVALAHERWQIIYNNFQKVKKKQIQTNIYYLFTSY